MQKNKNKTLRPLIITFFLPDIKNEVMTIWYRNFENFSLKHAYEIKEIIENHINQHDYVKTEAKFTKIIIDEYLGDDGEVPKDYKEEVVLELTFTFSEELTPSQIEHLIHCSLKSDIYDIKIENYDPILNRHI